MRICIVNPFYDSVASSSLEVTGRYRHVESLASALARRGHDVVVVQAFHGTRIEHRNQAEFRYIRTPHRSVASLYGGFLGLELLTNGSVEPLVQAVKDVRPDAVHMNGLTLLHPLSGIGEWCRKSGRPFTASYHGGKPRPSPWLQPVQGRILARCTKVFFTTPVHAREWLTTGLLREHQIVACMEVSSNFMPADRSESRARTGMRGHPVLAWNARLHPIKDPLTALKGFSLIRKGWPNARLYMIHYTNEMQAEIRHMIASDPALADGVEMRGLIPPAAVEGFLNSSDFLIQTSIQEVAGYSVLEAMSCGVIPIITDIPSFRAMTDEGRSGFLFPIGDHQRMAEQALAIDLGEIERLSRKVREFFVERLSYDAIARTYENAFRS